MQRKASIHSELYRTGIHVGRCPQSTPIEKKAGPKVTFRVALQKICDGSQKIFREEQDTAAEHSANDYAAQQDEVGEEHWRDPTAQAFPIRQIHFLSRIQIYEVDPLRR
mmetsp:Transcript_34235/g.83029  ORF Transcript_34235/g.83029 Transcript_34235/m.83029 type:complete len:109 (-) Transcript_34235:3534-3860(-)